VAIKLILLWYVYVVVLLALPVHNHVGVASCCPPFHCSTLR